MALDVKLLTTKYQLQGTNEPGAVVARTVFGCVVQCLRYVINPRSVLSSSDRNGEDAIYS